MSKIMQYEAIAKYDSKAQELLEKYKQIKNDNTILPLIESSSRRYGYDEDDDENTPF